MQQTKQIAEDLLQGIKALGFDRHKLIIQVPPFFMPCVPCTYLRRYAYPWASCAMSRQYLAVLSTHPDISLLAKHAPLQVFCNIHVRILYTC